MKRDLNLIRKLVLLIEDAPIGWAPKLEVDGYSASQVGYHAHLLIEAGLARGVDVTTHGSEGPQALITALTWAGHEFAALARDDTRWNGALSSISNGAQAITFEALKGLLINAIAPSPEAAQKGYQFERDVAAIYRALGARVVQDTVLAGNQIDIFIEEQTSSGSKLRTAVECKAYARPVGIDVVNQFASLVALLKQRGMVDRGAIVTSHGFTHQARDAGKDVLELLEIADLKQRVQGKTSELKAAEIEIDAARRRTAESVLQPPRIFVLMPRVGLL